MTLRDLSSPGARRVLALYLTVQVAVTAALLVPGWLPGGAAGSAVDAGLQGLAAGVAAWAILWRAGAHARTRRTWRRAGLAAVFWCAGQLWLTGSLALTGRWDRPSPADVLFVLSAGLALAAALSFPSLPQDSRGRSRLTVDGSILAGSVLVLVLQRLGVELTGPSQLLTLAYPLADCVVITVLLMAAMRAPRSLLPSLGTAAAGLLVLSVANLETFRMDLAHQATQLTPVNAGFAAGLALVGLGALLQSPPVGLGDELVLLGQRLLPYALLPVVGAVLVGSDRAPSPAVLAVLAAVAGLLLLRQLLVVEENAALASDVVRRARRYEALVQGSAELVLVVGRDGAISYRSPSAEEALAGRPSDSLYDLVCPAERADIDAALQGGRDSCQWTLDPDHLLWARFTDMTADPAVRGIVVNARDVTEQARAARALADSEQRFRRIVETAQEGIWVTDAQGLARFVNPRAAEMLGLPVDELVGRAAVTILGPLMDEAGRQLIEDKMRRRHSAGVETYEFALSRSDGTRLHTQVTASPLYDATGAFDGSLTMISDITARVVAEEQLRRDARTDPLTGLANRTFFAGRVADALAHYDPAHPPALVYCDLDGFKAVNDAWGHGAGDELLKRVAERLAEFERPRVAVGRLGGDEFAVLLEAISHSGEPEALAAHLLDTLREPYSLSDREHHIDLSVGIAVAGPDDDVESLLRNGDLAMYQAKSDGRGRFRRYESTMHRRASDRLELEQDLRHAVERGELLLHYQPVLSLQGGGCVGAEALVRWQHPELGLVAPDQFIPLAEGSDLILSIGSWVLAQALADARHWPSLGEGPVVSVNVAPRQLMDDRHVSELVRLLRDSGLPTRQVLLEVTERSLLAGARPRAALRTLRATGTRLALDDFGTGYSSLAHLRDHPVDVLKLDRSYVTQVSGDTPDRRLTLAILELGRHLGIDCTAEGIETEEQAATLAAAGCAHGQGYLFARPMPQADLLRYLADPAGRVPAPRRPEGRAVSW